MLKEKYNTYKEIYKDYIILIKCGSFYLSLNDDAIVMNRLFNYKIKETTNLIKVGFPITSLSKIEKALENKHINYLIVNDDNIQKYKYKNNSYSKYSFRLDNYDIFVNRINKIYEVLKANLGNSNLKTVLNEIEELLCKINY